MRLSVVVHLFLFIFGSYAQTLTTTNAAGNTIVGVLTTDPIQGETTQVIQTILPTETSSTPDVQQGPVGQPASNTGIVGGPTPFTYTTTNANGVYTAVVATFTPSFPATISPPQVSSGTVLDYSQWLSVIGTNTPSAVTAAGTRKLPPFSWAGVSVMLCGIAGGAWMVLP